MIKLIYIPPIILFLSFLLFCFPFFSFVAFASAKINSPLSDNLFKNTSPAQSDTVYKEWDVIYDSGFDDKAVDIAVDNFGNIYVTGNSGNASFNRDYKTVKYSPTGEIIWEATYDGDFEDVVKKLVLDESGNVYLTGNSIGRISLNDYLTVKYNKDGVEQWSARYNGTSNINDYANDIAIDSNGNVFVTGYSSNLGTFSDYTTIKYNSAGVQQWIKEYNGPVSKDDVSRGIAIDKFENIIVTGSSIDTLNKSKIVTIKYNNDGDELWIRKYFNPGDYPNKANALAVDSAGNIYVTGFNPGIHMIDYITIKYNSEGEQKWVRQYNGPGNDYDEALFISVTGSGNICITGTSLDTTNRIGIATIQYDSSGNMMWVRRVEKAWVTDMAVDRHGNVYVTGEISDPITYYITIKYNMRGDEQWQERYRYDSYGLHGATGIAVDTSGKIYVTGSFERPGSLPTFNWGTIKYGQKAIPVELTAFSASIENNIILLKWITATEINNRGFSVERQTADKPEWENIGFVSGNGTSTINNSYEFRDSDISPGMYRYRLKQIDYDGSFEYSEEIEVIVGLPDRYMLYQNFPNPFNPITNIKFSLPLEENVTLILFNTLGEEIGMLINEKMKAGVHELPFNAASLPSGVYFYMLRAGEYTNTKKLIVLR